MRVALWVIVVLLTSLTARAGAGTNESFDPNVTTSPVASVSARVCAWAGLGAPATRPNPRAAERATTSRLLTRRLVCDGGCWAIVDIVPPEVGVARWLDLAEPAAHADPPRDSPGLSR